MPGCEKEASSEIAYRAVNRHVVESQKAEDWILVEFLEPAATLGADQELLYC
jgi:hypothetical protein